MTDGLDQERMEAWRAAATRLAVSHRQAAKQLIEGGTLLNVLAPAGSIPWAVAQWHLEEAARIEGSGNEPDVQR